MSELAAAVSLITLCKTRQNVVVQVGLLVELQAQIPIDPMGAIKRDANHNSTLPEGVSLGNGGHMYPEIPDKMPD